MSQETLSSETTVLETTDERGRGLRVELFRLNDRYAHRLIAFDAENNQSLLLETIEGIQDGLALQSLHLGAAVAHPDGNHRSPPAMLLGMSGSNHWSLSIESAPSCDAEPTGLAFVFEGACRVKQLLSSWGSEVPVNRYAVVLPTQPTIVGAAAKLDFGWGCCLLEPTGAACHLDDKQQAIVIDSTVKPTTALPTTLRWSYTLRLFD